MTPPAPPIEWLQLLRRAREIAAPKQPSPEDFERAQQEIEARRSA